MHISHNSQLIARLYRRVFNITEIEREPILQWTFGGLLFFFFVAFNRWFGSSLITVEGTQRGTSVCWEYFQSCERLFFLHDLGVGYSQSIFYMALYTVMAGIVYCMWRRKWVVAHALMVLLLIWEAFVVLVLSFNDGAPYYYYHIALVSTLLFVPHKEFFVKLTFVFLYFMSVTVKIDATWILGTYFTALRDGLPLFPDALTAPITNLVIFMQMIGAWFLMSRRRLLQRAAFVYFVVFHLYSGVFVSYFYPSVSLPTLLIMFGPLYRHTPIPFGWKTFAGWSVIALLAAYQVLGFLPPGDRRMTLEGNKFGMFMFEANHQCAVTIRSQYRTPLDPLSEEWEASPGTPCSNFYCLVQRRVDTEGMFTFREERYESGSAWNRCYPYAWWYQVRKQCARDDIVRISLQLDHSINGGPFYRTVDADNICELEYRPWFGNEWIKQPPEAPLIGYPVTNTYN